MQVIRPFPIQGENRLDHDGKIRRVPAQMVPWAVAEMAFQGYAKLYGDGAKP
jgi:hypothetical protein